eukprot:s1103_g2.t1
MSYLRQTWHFISGKQRITPSLRKAVRKELMELVTAAPLLHCNLSAMVSHQITVSDASTTGGAVGFATGISEEGFDFLQATKKVESFDGVVHAPVLLLSLFNGVGGALRCYDIAGVCPLARIAVEIDEGANRITSRRWPGTHIINDIRAVDRALVRQWSLTFLQVREVHIWGGFPCKDLSAVKANRLNLAGSQSSLYWEIPRIAKLVEEEFGPSVIVKKVLENVASMDRSAAEEISYDFGAIPYRLDCSQAVPMRRPRFTWTTEHLESLMPDVYVTPASYWKEVHAEAPYPDTSQWLTPGYSWEGEKSGAIFPTCMRSIPRDFPPTAPAGLEKCDAACRQQWYEDCATFFFQRHKSMEQALLRGRWESSREMRSYTNVAAAQDDAAFPDAYMFLFTEDTRLDIQRAVGYKSRWTGKVYCVAPLVDTTMSAVEPIYYWAIGEDCCEARSDFHCGDAQDPSTRSGLVALKPAKIVRPYMRWAVRGSPYQRFEKAVRLEEATHVTQAAPDPTFIYWSSDPIALKDSFYKEAVHACVLWSLIYFAVLLVGAPRAGFRVHQRSVAIRNPPNLFRSFFVYGNLGALG